MEMSGRGQCGLQAIGNTAHRPKAPIAVRPRCMPSGRERVGCGITVPNIDTISAMQRVDEEPNVTYHHTQETKEEYMSLGRKIEQLRRARGLTLYEVADGSGLTSSFLSRLERDKVTISVANLRRLATFFKVPMTYFFEGDDRQRGGQVVRAADRVQGSRDDASVRVGSLLPPNHDLEAFLIEAYPGSSQRNLVSRGSQMIYVLTGTVRYTCEHEQYDLTDGDTLFLRAHTVYHWTNIGASPAMIVTVSTLNVRDKR